LKSSGVVSDLEDDIYLMKEKIKRLEKENQDLYRQLVACNQIKYADENLFAMVRCINAPRQQVCKAAPSGGDVCRSRLIDCTKFRTLVQQDPVALQRMTLVQDVLDNQNPPYN
jgi:hypothetical protein